MGLNIKNERVCALARQAAEVTGGSQTSAIEEALLMLLQARGHDPEQGRVREKRVAVDTILHRVDLELARVDGAGGALQIDDLYDVATGLPR